MAGQSFYKKRKDNKMQNHTINVPVTLLPQTVNDIIITAIEGGINYWCETVLGDNLEVGNGAVIKIIEDGGTWSSADDVTHKLDLDKFRLGMLRWVQKNPDYGCVTMARDSKGKLVLSFDAGMIDAGMADCIIQYALFTKLKYA
tara:strand:+ start:368 stop:799 length:432 start_codon:yes stop_codon:yes gene_type:complete